MDKAKLQLHTHTYYYMLWVALGMADDQEEWDDFEMYLSDMEERYGYDYLAAVMDLCLA